MRARQTFMVSLLVGALALLSSMPCLAAPDALTDKAATLYDEGMVSYGKAKWPEARASFLAAWALKNHWQIAGSLGDCEVQLGLYREAAAHLAYFLRLAPPERRTAAAKRLYDVARSKVGTLAVTVDVGGADVAVDGSVVGKAPLEDPLFVEPGAHTVEVRLGDYAPSRARVELVAGASKDVALVLGKEGVTPPVSVGPSKGIVIGGAAVTGVGIVMGAVFAGIANSKSSDVTSKDGAIVKMGATASCGATLSTSCQALHGAIQDQATFGNASAWSFIAAGAVGAGTLIYALVPRSAKASGMRAAPLVAAHTGGVVLHGAW